MIIGSGCEDGQGADQQADEVEVFGMFGGDLPVLHHSRKSDTENEWATVHTMFRQGANQS
ncbi:hypothetical protein [Paenibacillus sp. 7541]|uniref:Uncharacterized protein n=1 Tax=Paenibacillus campinasensis TaxID=66347 RepID=A0A268EEJ5_9BACL|nr:hypothetical protein [Paenibacillus sp. 7541]PAD71557.1 hypothetical protein CHH67_24125 [Paenibacillus campinasensis]PAK50745.1 hypothetical protein CHH75_16045 [Paenibacillus sp. 7541]